MADFEINLGYWTGPKAAEKMRRGDTLYWDDFGKPVDGQEGAGCFTIVKNAKLPCACVREPADVEDRTVDVIFLAGPKQMEPRKHD
jgi:hypothetical protein